VAAEPAVHIQQTIHHLLDDVSHSQTQRRTIIIVIVIIIISAVMRLERVIPALTRVHTTCWTQLTTCSSLHPPLSSLDFCSYQQVYDTLPCHVYG